MRRPLVLLALAVLAGASCYTLPGRAQPQAADASADEERERKIIERFVGILEKNPRRGTALDRVYGYHVERGTLDQLIGELKKVMDPNRPIQVIAIGIGNEVSESDLRRITETTGGGTFLAPDPSRDGDIVLTASALRTAVHR